MENSWVAIPLIHDTVFVAWCYDEETTKKLLISAGVNSFYAGIFSERCSLT